MADAVILDRGYRHYDGPRYGRAGAMRAIVREGIRRILGLRRKARRKIIPWSLIAITLVGATVFIAIHFIAGEELGEVLGFRNGELFDFLSVVWLLFIALAAPELLIPDRTQGVLSIYFSRPLRISDYLAAKAGALAALVTGAYLIPQLALFIGLAALSEDGFLGFVRGNLDVLWKIVAITLIYMAVHSSVAMSMSALIPKRGFAIAAFLGALLILNPVVFLISQSSIPGARYYALLAIEQHPRIVRDWAFDIQTVDYIPAQAGFEPWHSLAVALVVVIVAWVIIWIRYRKLA